MFRVVNCVLTSVGGKMQADITLSGTGYDKLYTGTAKEAAASASGRSTDWVFCRMQKENMYLQCQVDKYGYRSRRLQHMRFNSGNWYDRTLIFKTEGMTKYVQRK